MEQSYPALFAAGVLMLLARRPLAGPWVALRGRLLRAALAADRGLARALVVLRRRMLLSCALLSRAALTAAGRGLTCALVLLRGRPLRTCTTLAGRGRLAGALSATPRTAHVRHAERGDGLAVESSADFQALATLERGQRPYRARAEPAVRTADAEPFLVQHDLGPADLLLRQVHFGYARGAAAAVQCRPARPHRYGRDDLAAAVDDDDLVTHHEVLVSAPLRIDFDERGGHIDNPNARRYRGSDAQREVDVVHARYVPAGEDGLLDPRALLRVERHAATGSLRTLLRLTLLTRSLGLVALPALTLRRALALIALSLAGGLVPLALAALLRLTLLALALLGLALLGLALLALTLLTRHALVRHALALLALAHALVMLALFALVARRLPCGLVPLAALRSGAVLHLRAAGLFTARHLLGRRYADSRQ